MEKPQFIVGDENKFLNYIEGISGEKTALISHNDLDGLTSAKVVSFSIKINMIKFVDYIGINEEVVRELKEKNFRKVIFTDLNIDNPKIIRDISKFAEVLIIDHHRLSEDFSSDRITFLNAQGFCAGYLCYYLFSKIKNIDKLDWLVACSCLSDWLYISNNGWMKQVYNKYGEEFRLERDYIRQGRFWELQEDLSAAILYFSPNVKRVFDQISDSFGDIGDLDKYANEVKKEVRKSLERFSKESVIVKKNYFWELSAKFPVKEIVVNILSMEKPDATFIVAEKRGTFYKISARRQDGSVDLPNLMKKLCYGFRSSSAGGHIRASGANFPVEYFEEFKKRLREY